MKDMLGDKIRSVRKRRKMSINKLSKLTGIALGYLSDLENNKANNPTMDKINKIAEVLQIPSALLLGSDDIPEEVISEFSRGLECIDKPVTKNGQTVFVKREVDDEEKRQLSKEFLSDMPELFFGLSKETRKKIMKNIEKSNEAKGHEVSTTAAHRTDGYDEPLTPDEAAAVKAFLDVYRKTKSEGKN